MKIFVNCLIIFLVFILVLFIAFITYFIYSIYKCPMSDSKFPVKQVMPKTDIRVRKNELDLLIKNGFKVSTKSGHINLEVRHFEKIEDDLWERLIDASKSYQSFLSIDSYNYDKANNKHYFLFCIDGTVMPMRFYGGYYTLDKKKNRISDLKLKLFGYGNRYCELEKGRQVFLDMIQNKKLTPIKSKRNPNEYDVYIVDSTYVGKE